MAQCSYIIPDTEIDLVFNKMVEFVCSDGTKYIYFHHDDGYGEHTTVQFCSLCGRKRDVFECLNESEWKKCRRYLNVIRGGK